MAYCLQLPTICKLLGARNHRNNAIGLQGKSFFNSQRAENFGESNYELLCTSSEIYHRDIINKRVEAEFRCQFMVLGHRFLYRDGSDVSRE